MQLWQLFWFNFSTPSRRRAWGRFREVENHEKEDHSCEASLAVEDVRNLVVVIWSSLLSPSQSIHYKKSRIKDTPSSSKEKILISGLKIIHLQSFHNLLSVFNQCSKSPFDATSDFMADVTSGFLKLQFRSSSTGSWSLVVFYICILLFFIS